MQDVSSQPTGPDLDVALEAWGLGGLGAWA